MEIRQDPAQLLRTRAAMDAAVDETVRKASQARRATKTPTGWKGVDKGLSEYGDALRKATRQLERLGERVGAELQAAVDTMQSTDTNLADRFRDS